METTMTTPVQPNDLNAQRARASISKIVSQLEEEAARFDLAASTFATAYAELRRLCPRGDLHIHLTIDGEA